MNKLHGILEVAMNQFFAQNSIFSKRVSKGRLKIISKKKCNWIKNTLNSVGYENCVLTSKGIFYITPVRDMIFVVLSWLIG